MLKMFVLLEAFDAADLQIAQEVLAAAQGARRADAGRRQLPRSRHADASTCRGSASWPSYLPPDFASVAESGVGSLEDVKTVVDVGYDVALVGTTLMNSGDPGKLLGEMLAAGRERAMAVRTRKMRIATGAVDGRRVARGDLGEDLRPDDARCGRGGGRSGRRRGRFRVRAVEAASHRAQATQLAQGVPRRIPRVAVMLHPTQSQLDEVWSVFRPDVLQTDVEDLATLRVPVGLSVMPVVRDGVGLKPDLQPESTGHAHALRRPRERHRQHCRLARRGAARAHARSWCSPAD